jgi:hypothetical protein
MVVASRSVIVDDMTEHRHAAGQELRILFKEENGLKITAALDVR